MTAPSAARRAWFHPRLLLPLAVFLAIVGLKFVQVDRYGSDLPFWDQWDAEGDRLLRPCLEGTLHLADFFQPHNEHRPVLTRVLALGLFKLNDGIWDARVEMLVNALLHAASALCLLAFARRFLSPFAWGAFGVLLVVLFGQVLSWENTLAGFQSQFYFILLFSALHLGGTLLAPPRSWAWWLAPLAGAAALLSMASGLLSAAAILAVVALRALRDRRLAREDFYVIAWNVALFAVGWALKLDHPGHEHLKASGLGVWLDAFLRQYAWPTIGLWAAPLGLLPSVAFVVAYLRRRVDGPVAYALLGAIAWFALQCAALAYGRGSENHAYGSRYTDTLSAGIAIGVLAVGFLAHTATAARARRSWLAYLAVLLGVAAIGALRETRTVFRETLDFMASVNAIREDSVRRYVANHDPEFFKRLPWDELPYPSAARLATLLDLPSLRSTLPMSVRAPVAFTPAAATRDFAPLTSKVFPAPSPRALKTWSSRSGADALLVTEPFRVTRPRLTIFAACSGTGSNALELVAADGRRIAPLGALPDTPRWKRLNFAVPAGEYRLEARHIGDGALALTEPVETAALPTLAAKIPRLGVTLLIAGGALGLLCFLQTVQFPTPPKLYAGGRRVAVLVAPLLLGLSLGFIVLDRLGWIHHPAPRRTDDFGLTDPAFPGQPDRRFVGAAFVVQGPRDFWCGTYVNGDAFTGTVTSTSFQIRAAMLHVPVLGYPHTPDTDLMLEILDDGQRPVAHIAFDDANPKEMRGTWNVSVAQWIGREARLVLSDRSTAAGGWLAVSAPQQDNRAGIEWLSGIPRSYAWFVVSALACFGLLFLPGLALRTWWPEHFPFGPAFLALPGMLALATLGLLIWRLGPARMQAIALAWVAAHGVLAIALTRRWAKAGGPLRRTETAALGIYASVVVSALAFGILPLGVAQEYDFHSSGQARMIASPPDHCIPYRTAVYFFYGKTGEDREVYFADQWSVTSRGPLAPLMINAAFVLFGTRPTDPPSSTLERWPTPDDGFYLARIVGVLTNALVILAGAALAAQLAPGSDRAVLCWLAAAPIVTINTDFLWPKLLATFFFLLALRATLAAQPLWRAAVFGALAYFSHPVGALFLPPLVLFIGDQAWRHAAADGRVRFALWRMASFTLIFVACLSPWLAFKAWLGGHDVFVDYPLGDGRGFQHAASVGSWLRCRWDNLWITLLPGGFFLSDNMHGWLQGPISQPLRWVIGYAKSLPGALGLAGFVVAAVVAGRRPSPFPVGFRRHLFLGAFLLLLIFWGFSGDGLGRNCLEPLAILAIVCATVTIPAAWRGLRWLLFCTALEALSVRVLGVIYEPSFSPAAIDSETITLAIIVVLAMTVPPLWLALTSPEPVQPCAANVAQAAP